MAQPAPAAPATTELDDRKQQQCAQRWIAELTLSEKAQRKWLERARKITKLYKRENSQDEQKRRFAMLWSNTETIKPAVYARAPQAVVTRRFNETDPVARAASEVLERCLAGSIELQDLDSHLKATRDDFVLVGRGQTWERYKPTLGPQVVPEIELQVVTNGDDADADPQYVDDDGNAYEVGEVNQRPDGTAYAQGEPYQPVVFEESLTDYVNWEDFGHSVARTWDEVWYVWRRVYLSREQLVERFGAIGKVVPLDWGPIKQGVRDDTADLLKKAAIYEIWDRNAKKVYWISKSWSSRPLDERDDPLQLDGFFPCPRPMLATTANDSVIPTPDYVFYQDQAEEIDHLTDRIQQLQEAIKVRGFYAADQKTNLNTLFNSSNNILLPVPDWTRMKEGGGVAGNIEWFPIQQVVSACNALIEQRGQLISDVYQITGVADILRGMNDPRATATAERIKGAWGTLRIRTKQVEMMRFARDGLRIKAQVIAGKFEVDTLKAMSGVDLPTQADKAQAQQIIAQGAQQYQMAIQQAQMAQQPPPPQPSIPQPLQDILSKPAWEDVQGLLRDDSARNFRIDIETDSTIEPDESDQKAQAVEFMGAMSQMISTWGPAVQAQPALAPMAAEFIKWGARFFRIGKSVEDIIDTTMDKIAQMPPAPPPGQQAAKPPAPPPDTTPIQVAQVNYATEQLKQQGETQRAVIEAQSHHGDQNLEAANQQLKLVSLNRDPQPQVNLA